KKFMPSNNNEAAYKIEFWEEKHPHWEKLKALSASLGDSKYVFIDDDPVPFYAAVALNEDNDIIGYHVFLVQPIGPEMGTSEIKDRHGNTLTEAKIRALHVLEPFRNQGIGTKLQLLTLEKGAELGAFQVRSRSNISKVENYVIKIKLGFACHPDLRTYKDGTTADGVYWVKRI
ncbi:MAG: GNAT family N-acetyltransferase, partial [Chloroflexota bacterium]